MPFVPARSLTIRVSLAYDEARRQAIQGLLDAHLREPVYRELLREANELVGDNTRSALVLAVAAAEIAIKTIVLELNPEMAGLLEGKEFPTALEMYRDYLPTLPVRCTINGKVLTPSASILKDFEKAVHARNRLVHWGAPPLDRDSMIHKLNTIRDLVLLVDYYRGFDWAFQQMIADTKADLTLRASAH